MPFQENVYENLGRGGDDGASTSAGWWRAPRAAGAGAVAQTLEFNERGARPPPAGAGAQGQRGCTMPRARGAGAGGAGGAAGPVLVVRACSCHLLPESHAARCAPSRALHQPPDDSDD